MCETERGVSRASIVSEANGKATSRRKTEVERSESDTAPSIFYYAWIGYSDALFYLSTTTLYLFFQSSSIFHWGQTVLLLWASIFFLFLILFSLPYALFFLISYFIFPSLFSLLSYFLFLLLFLTPSLFSLLSYFFSLISYLISPSLFSLVSYFLFLISKVF